MRTHIAPDEKGLRCSNCGHDRLDTVDSRPSLNAVRRRRRCPVCRHTVTTYEVVSPTADDLRLTEALRLFDMLRAMPQGIRQAIMVMIRAVDARPHEPLLLLEAADPPAVEGALL